MVKKGARGKRCPPGVVCLPNGWIIAFVVVGVLLATFFIYNARNYGNNGDNVDNLVRDKQQPYGQQQQQQQHTQQTNIIVKGGDDRYSRAPVPLRIWPQFGNMDFSTTNMPFNIPTQGYPPNFSSVGILTTDDGQVLPLYGRPSTYGSDRYNYYTRTDTYNPVPLPVRFGKRDCMDDNGCQEVFNKDKIHISATGKEATATIYKYDSPKYIP